MSTTSTTVALPPIDRTALSEEHAAVIRATLPLVGSKIDEITPLFYSKMFGAHPELLRDTFNRANQKQSVQPKALAASIATFATMLVDENAPAPEGMLTRIAHKHVSLGIVEEQYDVVHDNLFAAIVEVLGADTVTPEVAAAWDAVYWIMARVLFGFERELYRGAGVADGDVFRTVEVEDKVLLPGGVAEFTVRSLTGLDPLPDHAAGQYISVRGVSEDGARQLRQYSLVDSGIAGDGRLTFAAKLEGGFDENPAGEVSTYLHESVEVGDTIEITLPFGDLVLDPESADPVVLISSGIGATPMIGMLGSLAGTESDRRVVVLHAEDSERTDALAEARAAHLARLDNASGRTFYREDGELIDLASLGLPEDAQYYLCGSNVFLQNLRAQLSDLGVEESRVHVELFSPNDWLID